MTIIIFKFVNQKKKKTKAKKCKSSPFSVTEFLSLHPSVDGTFIPPRKKARTDVSHVICLVLCLLNLKLEIYVRLLCLIIETMSFSSQF